jgi:hypothetical protein
MGNLSRLAAIRGENCIDAPFSRFFGLAAGKKPDIKLHVHFAAMQHASDIGSGPIAGQTIAEPLCSFPFGTIEETET